MEIILQTVSYVRYYNALLAYGKINFLSWYYKDKRNEWWIKESASIKPAYDPFLGFIFRNVNTPNVHINDIGARETKYNSPGNINVYFFGGSTMAGWSVKDDETIPSYVMKNLNETAPQYAAVNFGQIAYNSNQEIIYLQQRLKKAAPPQTVIFYDGCNEVWISSRNIRDSENNIMYEKSIKNQLGDPVLNIPPKNSTLINKRILSGILPTLSEYIKIIHYPAVLIQKIFGYKIGEDKAPSPDQSLVVTRGNDVAENYLNNIRIVDALAKEYKFTYLFVWQPMRFAKPLTPDEAQSYSSNQYWVDKTIFETATNRIKEKSPDNYLDISEIFKGYPNKSIYFDYCHITPEGNRIVAKAIADKILQTQTIH